jgi:beta-glucosidase
VEAAAALDRATQARLTAGASMWGTHAVPEAGIRPLTLADGPMGVASGRIDERDISVLTPAPVCLGASWNLDLIRRVGALVGGEAARCGVDMILAPNVNLARSPLAGRAFEYFSEDPLLTGLAGAAWVEGVQSAGTGAVPKHLVCNDSETQRDTVDVRVDERTLREVYLLPFQLCAEAGAAGMLTAYNRVNGRWCSEQAHVITDIAKGEWGFPGLFMSDWFGTHSTVGTLGAGLDLEMPGPARFLGDKALDAVEAGEVAPKRLADAAVRLAHAAERFAGTKPAPMDVRATDALLREAAADGFVLLRNEGDLLPLVPGRDKVIAVIGPNATNPCYQGGTFAKIAVDSAVPTPLDELRARFADQAEILYEPGVDPQPRLPSMPVSPARDLGDGARTGMTLDYFDEGEDGAPVFSETRDTNSLVWFVGVHDQAAFNHPGRLRATGRFRATTTGRHRVYLGATGAASLCVNGRTLLDQPGGILPADVMGVLKAGDAAEATLDLRAGDEVLVEVAFFWSAARVHGLWYGIRPPGTPDELLQRAVAAAARADAVLLLVGETSDASVESKDRQHSRLAPDQLQLIEAVSSANPRTAVIVNVGHAFDASWGDAAPALLSAWYPGQAFSTALAEVVAGDREPGGRLAVTLAAREADYPAFDLAPAADGALYYSEGVLVGYRGLAASGTTPLHPFGSGLGYAKIDLIRSIIQPNEADGVRVRALLKNHSDRPGSQVVQVYRRQPEPALVGFAKGWLDAHEEREVEVLVPADRLRVWQGGWQPIAHPDLVVGLSAGVLC